MNRTLAPKDLGGILGETFTIYKNNFLKFIAIVAIMQVPIFILYGIYIVAMLSGLDKSDFLSNLFLFYILLIPIGLLLFAASIWMIGAIIHAVSEQCFNQPVDIGRAYSFAWRRLGAMFGAAFIVYVVLMGIYIAAILIGVIPAATIGGSSPWLILIMIAALICIALPATAYLGVNWNFILQTALLERCSPTSALSRSWALVKGSWWRVLGIILLLYFIIQTIMGILAMIFYIPAIMAIVSQSTSAFTPYGAPEFPIWIMVGPLTGVAIGSIISLPIFVIGQTLLYFDLRVRKEGYSLDTLANELGLSSPTTDIAATSPPV